MQASSMQFDKVLKQGAAGTLQDQANLIRTSRKAGKEEAMKVKVIFRNHYLFPSKLHMPLHITTVLTLVYLKKVSNYTEPLTVKTSALVYIKQQNYSLLKGIILLLLLPFHAPSIPLCKLQSSSNFSVNGFSSPSC